MEKAGRPDRNSFLLSQMMEFNDKFFSLTERRTDIDLKFVD